MKKNTLVKVRRTSVGLCSSFGVFAVALAMGVCSDFGVCAGIVSAVIGAFVCSFRQRHAIAPTFLIFLLATYTASYCGTGTAYISLFAAGIITLLLSFVKEETLEKYIVPSSFAGISIAAAFTMTVMQTTNYFGIGSSGINIFDMISDYVSLGFHGNWRGVFFGTVTLVIMITYPRKFKKFSNTIPASFISVVVTLALNLFLNPVEDATAISEVGRSISFALAAFPEHALFSGATLSSIPTAIASSLSMALIMTYSAVISSGTDTASEIRAVGIGNALSGLFGGIPMTFSKKDKFSLFNAPVLLVLFFACAPLIRRIPIATLAVILIVLSWQAVNWHEIKLSFTSGAPSLLLFILSIIFTIVLGLTYSVFICFAMCVIYRTLSAGRKEAEVK